MDQRELIRSVAERTGLSLAESADVTRAVLEQLAGQLSEGALSEDGYRHVIGQLPAGYTGQMEPAG